MMHFDWNVKNLWNILTDIFIMIKNIFSRKLFGGGKQNQHQFLLSSKYILN